MFLDSGRAIAGQIQALIDEEISQPVRLAVAFWGLGADYKLRGACEIICDLASGACNPAVIRALRKRDNCVVLKLSGLHAKVVIGSAGAVVSSANMSTNGLGAEGSDASGTIEAGYFVPSKLPEYRRIAAWFAHLWDQATPITELDLARAQQKWDFRNREMPAIDTASVQPQDERALEVDPWSLLHEWIDPDDRLRAVRPEVFHRLKGELPGLDPRRQGKVATWAFHLLLNRAGRQLDHSAGNGQPSGPATDEWIVSRLGTKSKNTTVEGISALLSAIGRDTFFSANVRAAANRTLSARPWMEH